MNYILHLNKTFSKFCEDERLTPFHISLYFALFQYWNIAKFRNPISVSRDEMMRAAKIGSVNTYIRCMKELDKWNYTQYIPSYNPQKGSQVYLYNFDKTNNNATDISNNKSSDKASEKANNKAGETQVIPSINSLNNTNKLNNTKEYEHTRRKNNQKSVDVNVKQQSKVKKLARPDLAEIKNYFAGKEWPTIEAEKFCNYFESNGWLVGGKTPMQNWKAAAKNWMLNAEKFSPSKTAGKLNATTNKNYNEPL